MSIKDIIEVLSAQGHDIKFRKRSDGGYIITNIDGVSFKGASGNIRSRKMVGAKLSQARSVQLARIRPPKKIAPAQRKLTKLPKELVKELRKVQREWRKKHEDISGTISMRGLRYQYEHYGEEAAKASLNKAFRYSQGYAYIDNVQFLIERLKRDLLFASNEDYSYIQMIIDKITLKQFVFKEDWISQVYEIVYEYEKAIKASSDHAYIVCRAKLNK